MTQLPSFPKLLHHIILFFWTTNFGRRNERLHHRNYLGTILAAVILTGDLSDFCTIICGELGLSELENELCLQ